MGAVVRLHLPVFPPQRKDSSQSSPARRGPLMELAPVLPCPGVTASFRQLYSPSQAAGESLPHCGPPQTAGGQFVSPWSSSQTAEESLLPCMDHLLLLLLYCLQGLQSSFTYSLLSLVADRVVFHIFPLFLNICQMCYHYYRWAWPWTILESAGTAPLGMGEASGSF